MVSYFMQLFPYIACSQKSYLICLITDAVELTHCIIRKMVLLHDSEQRNMETRRQTNLHGTQFYAPHFLTSAAELVNWMLNVEYMEYMRQD